ncbi:MAG: ATP-binding cassette domain-containing protein, partial [Gemmatimonadota bacterium]
MNVIETDGLTKRYGELTAVDAISFRVEPGQVFGFLGPNGSGKTTTIGMLLGIIRPTAGTIRLFGRTDRAGLHAARRRIGATLENPNFYPY